MRAFTPVEVAYHLLPLGLTEWVAMRMIALECGINEWEAREALQAARTMDAA